MTTLHAVPFACSTLLTTALATAQLPGLDAILVASDVGGATLVLSVDASTGLWSVLPPLPGDSMPPLAVVFDPLDRSLLIALDAGGSSVVMRRPRDQTSELPVGTVPGQCVDLLVDRLGDVVAVTGGAQGAIWRLPRLGGAASLVRAAPFASAANTPQEIAFGVILGFDGAGAPQPRDPAMGEVDLANGQYLWGPIPLAGFVPLGIRGFVDLPTGVPRQVLAHDDGSLSVWSWAFGQNPMPVPTLPALPPGGIAALKSHALGHGILLGGAASPHVYAFDPLQALAPPIALAQLTPLPLPGAPVDHALVPSIFARVWTFASPCGVAAELRMRAATGAPPRIGTGSFGLALAQGAPSQPAWLAVGFVESLIALPTGCRLRVPPVAILANATDAGGAAAQSITIPAWPGLIGVRFLAEWLQLDGGAPFMTSDVAAVEIGA
jgi:hypothetical protein